jgi:thiol-disulfide isomerase/thioredoxin
MSATPEITPTQRRDRSTPGWLLVAALALAWCAYLAFFGPKSPRGRLPQPLLSPPAGSVADYQWDLETLDGAPVQFGDFRGKPVFLNVWATWCPPCVAELPSINNLATNERLKGLPIVCVSVDADRETVARFAARHKLSATVLHAKGQPPPAFRTEGIPATFVLDSEGRVVVHEVGAAQWDTPQVVDFLAKLIEH